MRYFLLKNARRWKICQAPRPANEKIVNQAKFWTRLLVETRGEACVKRNEWRFVGNWLTIGLGESLLSSLEKRHLVNNFFHQTFQFPHFGLETRERLLVGNCTTDKSQITRAREAHHYETRTCNPQRQHQYQCPSQRPGSICSAARVRANHLPFPRQFLSRRKNGLRDIPLSM